MPDDDESQLWIMDARRRIDASRALLEASAASRAEAQTRLEASRKLLNRAQVDLINLRPSARAQGSRLDTTVARIHCRRASPKLRRR
jgi:hypothetical protein